jgi:hypothetical protein
MDNSLETVWVDKLLFSFDINQNGCKTKTSGYCIIDGKIFDLKQVESLGWQKDKVHQCKELINYLGKSGCKIKSNRDLSMFECLDKGCKITIKTDNETTIVSFNGTNGKCIPRDYLKDFEIKT